MIPRYMLDTNICIYIAKYQPAEVEAHFARLRPGQVVISAVTYGELCYGAEKSQFGAQVYAQLEKLVREIPVAELNSQTAEAYGRIRAALERQGKMIGNNDLWIGAHAVAMNLTIATNNEREFRRIPGLSVENWAK